MLTLNQLVNNEGLSPVCLAALLKLVQMLTGINYTTLFSIKWDYHNVHIFDSITRSTQKEFATIALIKERIEQYNKNHQFFRQQFLEMARALKEHDEEQITWSV